ncbi:XdhC family protein [Pseudactinotalea sp.]|uniref:XdhC family protein n=1 Tax=Pseudactinotalea sp. TaxID=1926260 RepID=UPI003B3A427D
MATVVEHPDPAAVGRSVIARLEDVASPEVPHPTPSLDATMLATARRLLRSGRSELRVCGSAGEPEGSTCWFFVRSLLPPPRMLVFGAVDFAAALANQGQLLGYRVTVCDARPVFATAERFPGAHEVVVAWPHVYLSEQIQAGALDERTVVCVLTHDMKFDVPLLSLALTHRRFAFIGAMGSRRTHQERRRRLIEAGVTEFELAALSSPIGLDLGARTPAETAVSIAAEIIAVRTGGTGERLRQRQGPIHAEPSRTQENEGERRERRSYVSR